MTGAELAQVRGGINTCNSLNCTGSQYCDMPTAGGRREDQQQTGTKYCVSGDG